MTNSIYIKKDNIKWIILYMFFIVVIFAVNFIFNLEPMISLKILGASCALELLFFIICNKKIDGRYLNFSSVFMLVLFVFNFGQLILYTFFHAVYSHIRFLVLFNPAEALYGFKIINLAFSMISVGLLLGSSAKSKADLLTKKKTDRYNWYKFALILIILTFPVKLFIDAKSILISLTESGEAARLWVNTFPNVLLYYGKISLVGFALLLVLNKDLRKKTILLFLIEGYILLAMVSGIRSENVGYLLVFAFLYVITSTRKLKLGRAIVCGLMAVVVLSFIVATGEYRNATNKSFSGFMNIVWQYLTEKNVVFSLLDTLGDTGYTALCVINKWLPKYEPSYGKSYYLGIFAIIPNIPGVTDLPGRLTTESCFALQLQRKGTLSQGYLNIGGSMIGEFFFNFGIFGGTIVALIVGIIIGKVSINIKNALANDNYYQLIKYVPIMFVCIYWVRSYFGGGIREAVWGPLFCLLLLKLSCFRKKKQKVVQIKNGDNRNEGQG